MGRYLFCTEFCNDTFLFIYLEVRVATPLINIYRFPIYFAFALTWYFPLRPMLTKVDYIGVLSCCLDVSLHSWKDINTTNTSPPLLNTDI